MLPAVAVRHETDMVVVAKVCAMNAHLNPYKDMELIRDEGSLNSGEMKVLLSLKVRAISKPQGCVL